MTQPVPEQATPPPAATAPPAAPPPETGKTPPWGADENFDAAKAWELIENLRKEKGAPVPDPALQARFDALEKQQSDQRAALAKALGVAPEETSSADKLTETVTTLQAQFAEQQLKATRLEVAAANQIPAEFQGWLTATDPAALDAQAKQLVPMVQATLAARGVAPLVTPGQPVPPVFQPIPGQGQVGPTAQQQGGSFSDYYDEHGRLRS